MHMADALLSPAVGGSLWVASAAVIAHCSRKVRTEMNDGIIPLMGVLGAFIFSAQMINFSIPVTGSSGHLGGGLILAILLGPYAAFLTIASVLVVQAFFFADGGLLALGCNIFNLGFLPAFIAYPFIYKKIIGTTASPARISLASLAAAVVGLQMGAFAVVVETVASGITSLPFVAFATIMQPIHLAIGIVEGIATATVISFVYNARPEMLQRALAARPSTHRPARSMLFGFLAAAILTGGVISLYASERPDGLEWTIAKLTGQEQLQGASTGVHTLLATLQQKVAFLPDYLITMGENDSSRKFSSVQIPVNNQKVVVHGTDRNKLGSSISGIIGGTLTLGLALIIGYLLRGRGQTV
jgi:cobalt/nickel transport system permease protein